MAIICAAKQKAQMSVYKSPLLIEAFVDADEVHAYGCYDNAEALQQETERR